MRTIRWRLVGLGLTILLVPSAGHAQPPSGTAPGPTTFHELGRITSLTADALPFVTRGRTLTFQPLANGAQQGGEPLTNADVVKMVRAQLSTDIIIATIESAACVFELSAAGLVGLKEAGVDDAIIRAMQQRMRTLASGPLADADTRSAPEKSELLAAAKTPDVILRGFRTMLVDASGATFFGTAQMKARLQENKGFAALGIVLVDDPAVADVVLIVGYTFAWDYPFSLKHQNTSIVLLAGKGSGPFSGPKGASSVASELVKALKPYRVPAPTPRPER